MSGTSNGWDVVVVGAGSGGIGAALAASGMGLRTLLLEKHNEIGGNAVHGGVHVWEAGIGGTGLPLEIYRHLEKIARAVGVYSIGRHCCWPASNTPPFPGGELLIDPELSYVDSLRRHGGRGISVDESFVRRHWHGVVFEPEAYVTAVKEMLRRTDRCETRTGISFTEVECTDGRIGAATLDDGTRIEAGIWVDGTNTAALCRACGAGIAPPGPDPLNGVSLIYRITPAETPKVEDLPPGVGRDCWWADRFPVISCTQYPNGDRNCNTLPTMSGEECLSLGSEAAYRECERRVRAHWHWIQRQYPEFRGYRLSWIAPLLGIRETVHLECEYTLSEEDLLRGLPEQEHCDTIALADHAMDRHGKNGGCVELAAPYGIPFRCLVPKGIQNMLIASMAAGLSPKAATSCRLSRTMMQLGQAAGTAAALACRGRVDVRDVSAGKLRGSLRRQHVQLEWPMCEDLLKYVSDSNIQPAQGGASERAL